MPGARPPPWRPWAPRARVCPENGGGLACRTPLGRWPSRGLWLPVALVRAGIGNVVTRLYQQPLRPFPDGTGGTASAAVRPAHRQLRRQSKVLGSPSARVIAAFEREAGTMKRARFLHYNSRPPTRRGWLDQGRPATVADWAAAPGRQASSSRRSRLPAFERSPLAPGLPGALRRNL
jgi:hypothetical protein